MRSPTTELFRRIPVARWAPLLLAAAIVACSSNNSDTGGSPARLTLVTGGGLSATVGTAVGPIVVRVTDADTLPVEGDMVTFSVTGGATLSVTSVATDAQGQALTSLTLPNTVGSVTVTATADGITTPITFSETGVADQPATIVASGGNNQVGAAGTQLSDPMSATVTDQYGNPVSGVTITWTTTGGMLSTGSSRTAATGTAQTQLTLPGVIGPVTVTGTALIGSVNKAVNFTATAN
jgi:adhesin/invasin